MSSSIEVIAGSITQYFPCKPYLSNIVPSAKLDDKFDMLMEEYINLLDSINARERITLYTKLYNDLSDVFSYNDNEDNKIKSKKYIEICLIKMCEIHNEIVNTMKK